MYNLLLSTFSTVPGWRLSESVSHEIRQMLQPQFAGLPEDGDVRHQRFTCADFLLKRTGNLLLNLLRGRLEFGERGLCLRAGVLEVLLSQGFFGFLPRPGGFLNDESDAVGTDPRFGIAQDGEIGLGQIRDALDAPALTPSNSFLAAAIASSEVGVPDAVRRLWMASNFSRAVFSMFDLSASTCSFNWSTDASARSCAAPAKFASPANACTLAASPSAAFLIRFSRAAASDSCAFFEPRFSDAQASQCRAVVS